MKITPSAKDNLLVCIAPRAPMLASANRSARWTSEVLLGMQARLLPPAAAHARDGESAATIASLSGMPPKEPAAEFALVELLDDGYVGYVPVADFAASSISHQPTHRIAVPLSGLHRAPDCKAPTILTLPMHSAITLVEPVVAAGGDAQDNWSKVEVPCAGDNATAALFAATRHLTPLPAQPLLNTPSQREQCAQAYAVARYFMHAPYRWGGRTASGIDCSGLIQVSLWAAGVRCPRDSGDQLKYWQGLARASGAVEVFDYRSANQNRSELRCGDLLYWKKRAHVAMISDNETLLHANAHDMMVNFDDIDNVIQRTGEAPLTVRFAN